VQRVRGKADLLEKVAAFKERKAKLRTTACTKIDLNPFTQSHSVCELPKFNYNFILA
jgi:hypothetical protein